MKKLYAFAAVLLPLLSWAQVAWNFGTTTPGTASPSSGTPVTNISSISDLSQGNNNGTTVMLTSSSVSSGYTGASGSFNAGAAARTGALATGASGSAYFEFTVTPAAGFAVSITQIDFGTRSTSTGPQAFTIRSSLDNFAADAATPGSISNNSTWSLKQNSLAISGSNSTAVTIRIYGYNGTGTASAGTANWRMDDLSVTVGTVGGSGGAVITVNSAGLSSFSTITGTASAAQSITVSGSNLTSDINITPPAPYEISSDGGANFTTGNVVLGQTGGTVGNTSIAIRISAAATAGPANGSISLVSGTASQSVALTGTVSPLVTVNPPQAFAANTFSSSQINLTATGNAAGDDILVATNTSAVFGTPAGALTAGSSISGGGTVLYKGTAAGFNFQHTGLNAATTYYYKAWSADGSNNYSTGLTASATTASSPAANIVINQVYGGGGNSGATYKNDFIELYNNENSPVNLSGWSLQYQSATGTGNWTASALTGTIPAHSFFLVQEAAGTGGTTSLPSPDATGTLALGAAAGKVILSNSTVVLNGPNPTGATIIDKVGYGPTANGFETAPTAAPDNTNSVTRIADGVDDNNNSSDFAVTAPVPRNAGYTSTAPAIISLTPPNSTAGVPYNIVLSIVFDKKVVKGSGSITVYENGVAGTPLDVNDASVVLGNNNAVGFPATLSQGKSYYILVSPGAFKDVYNNNFVGITTATGWAFTTFTSTATSIPASFDFQNCTGNGLLPNGFTQFSVNGAAVWDCTSFGRDPNAPTGTAPFPNGVQMNGFDNTLGNVLNTDWLISPALDLTGTTYPLLSFYSRTKFNGAPLQLKVSTDYTGTGDPNLATWIDLNGKFPAQTSDSWTQSANINLAAYKQPKVFIAFVYTSTNDDGARWTLDDINIINSTTPPPPSLSLSTNSIEFFYAPPGNTVVKSFVVTGNDLTGGGGINVNTTGVFEVSKDNNNFAASINFTEAEANDQAKTVWVRFAPNQANQNFTGAVTVSTAGAVDTSVAVKGTSIDPLKTLEVVNWNMEWFGSSDPTLGPSNKAQQKANAQTILPAIGADLYALVEVVDTAALGNIVRNSMPGYNYIICNYGSHGNPFESGASPVSSLQKEAFVYNTAVISNIDTTSLLSNGVNTAADLTNPNYSYWSSGRYPFMMTADVTLGGIVKRIHFVAVHAKANTSPTATSYDRRKNGAIALHDYLNTQYPNDPIVILGDFNDDLDSTITDGISPRYSSYKVFTDDAAAFSSPTLTALSLTGKKSTVAYNDVIDHVVVSNELKPFFLNASATVLTDVASLVANYGSTTSDHYPIFTRFAFDAALLPVKMSSFTVVKNGKSALLEWKTTEETNSASFVVERSADGGNFTSRGTVMATGQASSYQFTDASPLSGDNYYRLKQVDKDNKFSYSKVLKLNFGKDAAVRFSPNPASSYLHVTLENIGSALTVSLLDGNGRLVKQLILAQGTSSADISLAGVGRGVYTVRMISQSGVQTQKVVIQ
jgi:hypothetical protein